MMQPSEIPSNNQPLKLNTTAVELTRLVAQRIVHSGACQAVVGCALLTDSTKEQVQLFIDGVAKCGFLDAFAEIITVHTGAIDRLNIDLARGLKRPRGWNIQHEFSLRFLAEHLPEFDKLKDQHIAMMVSVLATSRESGHSSEFLAWFLGESISALHFKHQKITAKDSNGNVKQYYVAEYYETNAGLRDYYNQFEASATSKTARHLLFNASSDELYVLTQGPFKGCTEWYRLLSFTNTSLSVNDITELQEVAKRVQKHKDIPQLVSSGYLSIALELLLQGEATPRDSKYVGIDPREPLLATKTSLSPKNLAAELAISLELVVLFTNSIYFEGRARYSGQEASKRFIKDINQYVLWIRSLRISCRVLVDAAQAYFDKHSKMPHLESLIFACFLSHISSPGSGVCTILEQLEKSGINHPLPESEGKLTYGYAFLRSSLLFDLARIGIFNLSDKIAEQESIRLGRLVSFDSILASFTCRNYIDFLKLTNYVIAPSAKSLTTDKDIEVFGNANPIFEDRDFHLGHQPELKPVLEQILRLCMSRPEGMTAYEYFQGMADALRLIETLARRKNRSPSCSKGWELQVQSLAAPNELSAQVELAHSYMSRFGAQVFPTPLFLLATHHAGHNLQELFPDLISSTESHKDALTAIADLFQIQRRQIEAGARGVKFFPSRPGPLPTPTIPTICQEAFLSSIGVANPSFSSSDSRLQMLSAIYRGGCRFSTSDFLPAPLPLPMKLVLHEGPIDECWPDETWNRYLRFHSLRLLPYTLPQPQTRKLSAGELSLQAVIQGHELRALNVRTLNKAETIINNDGKNSLSDVLKEGVNLISKICPYFEYSPDKSPQELGEFARNAILSTWAAEFAHIRDSQKLADRKHTLFSMLDAAERAQSIGEVLSICQSENYRVLNARNVGDAIRNWIASLTTREQRLILSAQQLGLTGVSTGIRRLLEACDHFATALDTELAKTGMPNNVTPVILDALYRKETLRRINTSLSGTLSSTSRTISTYGSDGIELSLAGLISDTCAIRELAPQSSRPNMAFFPFLDLDAPINRGIMQGGTGVIGVELKSGRHCLLLRGFNPSTWLESGVLIEDLFEGFCDQLAERARLSSSFNCICIPHEERSGGVLTNRYAVSQYVRNRYFKSANALDSDTAAYPDSAVYNALPITSSLCVVRSW